MTYTDVFGGANIYPADISYRSVALTSDQTLVWPVESSTTDNLTARIMDVVPTSGSYSLTLPNATEAGVGETILFNNPSAYAFTVKDSAGTQLLAATAGTVWQLYLTDNSTSAGTWRVFQYGAAVSAANAANLAGTGLVAIGTLLYQSVPVTAFNTDYTVASNDRAKAYNWTSTGAGTLTLSSPPTVGSNWFMYFRNSGDGEVVVTVDGSATIDSTATKAYQPGESSIIVCDGSDYFTVGFGQEVEFAFDYTVIDVAGGANYTLTGSELNRVVYKFTGVITANIDIVVPDTVQQYWVDNSTTGAFSLTVVSTTSGVGVQVSQGERTILYCDGTDVVDADTATTSYPIAVSQGGTGSTTAGGALINLGGGSTGIALFLSVNQATAWSALGVAPAGSINGGTF